MTGIRQIVEGLASWQQAVRLRDEGIHGLYGAISHLFPVPSVISDDLLLARLAEIVRDEEALRIATGTLDRGATVGYAPAIEIPFRRQRAGCAEEMLALAGQAAARTFERDGRPLWEFTVFSYTDEQGEPARSACVVLDHFVTDARSMQVMEQELTRDAGAPRPRGRGRYRDWVQSQRSQFPMPGGGSTGAAPEFWSRHLDGTSADRPTALPFTTVPARLLKSEVSSINLPIPVSSELIRSAARHLGLTPFVLIFASIAASVAAAAGTDDITLRVIVNGRPPGYGKTLGWFADSVPVRLASPGLHDPSQALATVRKVWAEVLEFQTTPLDYIRQACLPDPRLDVPPERRRMQLVVNYVPHDIGGMYSERVPERTKKGDIDGLHVVVLPGPDGQLRLGALFNPEHFPGKPTRLFLQRLVSELADSIRSHTHLEGA